MLSQLDPLRCKSVNVGSPTWKPMMQTGKREINAKDNERYALKMAMLHVIETKKTVILELHTITVY